MSILAFERGLAITDNGLIGEIINDFLPKIGVKRLFLTIIDNSDTKIASGFMTLPKARKIADAKTNSPEGLTTE